MACRAVRQNDGVNGSEVVSAPSIVGGQPWSNCRDRRVIEQSSVRIVDATGKIAGEAEAESVPEARKQFAKLARGNRVDNLILKLLGLMSSIFVTALPLPSKGRMQHARRDIIRLRKDDMRAVSYASSTPVDWQSTISIAMIDRYIHRRFSVHIYPRKVPPTLGS
jgi:hypothetical protein